MAMTPHQNHNGPEEVNDFIERLKHPLKNEVSEVRRIILSSTPGITEHIKWNAPSFCIDNDDRVTLELHEEDAIRLIFHCGEKVHHQWPAGKIFEDSSGLLKWLTNNQAVVRFCNMDELKTKEDQLRIAVKTWIEHTRPEEGERAGLA